MVLGLTEWYKERDKQLLKETSLLFYWLKNKWVKRFITTVIFSTLFIIREDYKISLFISWGIFSLLLILYAFWVQHKIDLKKPTAKESLEQYIEYRKSTGFPV